MSMTVGELRDLLESYDDDTEVRIAQQPGWPFEYSLNGVDIYKPGNDEAGEEDGEELDEPDCAVVYLIEGNQLGYLPGAVAKQISWD